ncbi:hypothetical protein GobsT_30280 [Gemmata obscuriglobus]|uniref:Ribosomal subunit interface protein n=1 Tax=Gemmata obscuriglobus TaxID=114 RepID=A0A2Z3H374_9BACT|nr:HPF/RaiA family ribosome-associated protein [Gemmata obscuriglobus]AWM38772.1 ribosomal subunit interface protein [Gemmata obscuriglobus]QEG28252.1 hypothetical protein GobsT_30280 [Gemmata obscuriglobus]VTS06039.1 ribosomal subunit interface protein : Sigma 54 modulation protein / S30EA ribosomal protein OS=Singulisphaera acidiphila (strain ATCC BAA-1392 / DSM 18658 / VKM B-2454 / MOB10) GN=Sinac_1280 PE=4 SV=1 [Gemmata obscuriglobus UQM 2246]
MRVEISTDTRTTVDTAAVTAEIENGLSRFRDRLTTVEVHLSDVNGPKGGPDCRCALEARAAGRQPVAVTNEAGAPEDAVAGAVDKMGRVLDSAFGRLDGVKGNTSASGLPT